MSTGIARAREELFAAHLLATTGFAAQCVGLCFRAALAAAEEALVLLDRPPDPRPAAVVAMFIRHVVRERGLDPAAGRRLRSLLNRSEQANADGRCRSRRPRPRSPTPPRWWTSSPPGWRSPDRSPPTAPARVDPR